MTELGSRATFLKRMCREDVAHVISERIGKVGLGVAWNVDNGWSMLVCCVSYLLHVESMCNIAQRQVLIDM